MRALLVALAPVALLQTALLAQGPISVAIGGVQSPRMFVGETVQLSAVFRDTQGNPAAGGAVNWTSSNTNVFTVTSGFVRAVGVGNARINLIHAGQTVFLNFQSLPKRVELTPANSTVRAGERVQFLARAWDVNDREIGGLRWNYFLGGGNGAGAAQWMPIDAEGRITASTAGYWWVRAWLNLDTLAPGFQRTVEAETYLTVLPQSRYNAKLVWSSEQTESQPVFREVQMNALNQLRGNDAGQIVIPAVLGTASNALLLYDKGTFKPLATGGQPAVARDAAGVVTQFVNTSINNQGEVLSRLVTGGETHLQLNWARGEYPYHANGASLAYDGEYPVESYATQAEVGRSSLNDQGNAIYQVQLRPLNRTVAAATLFYQNRDGFQSQIVGANGALEGLPAPYRFEVATLSIQRDDSMFFLATGANNLQVLYRHTLATGPKKLIGPGDTLVGSAVRRLYPATPPLHLFAQEGDAIVGVELDAPVRQVLLRYRKGDFASTPEQLRISCRCGVYSHTAAGTLIYSTMNDARGLAVWRNDNSVRPVLSLNATILDGLRVNEIEGAVMDANGLIRVLIRDQNNRPVLIEETQGGWRALLRAGEPIDVQVRTLVRTLLPGSRGGAPLVLSGAQSILKMTDEGPAPVFFIGDKWRAERAELFTGYGNGVQAPSGMLHVVGQPLNAVFRVTENGPEPVANTPYDVGGYRPWLYHRNANGDTLFMVGNPAGDNRLHVRLNGGDAIHLANDGTIPAQRSQILGETVVSFNSYHLDERGRVYLTFRAPDQQLRLVRWSNGTWVKLFDATATRINNNRVTNIFSLNVVGDRFFCSASLPGIGTALLQAGDDALEPVLLPGATLADGATLSLQAHDSNRSGRFAFVSGGGQGWSLYTWFEGKTEWVLDYSDLADSDLYRLPDAVVLQDDGTIWFSANTILGKRNIWKLTPKQ